MNVIQKWLGIKSPSAEVQRVYDEVILPNLLAGLDYGLAIARNCRCVWVYTEPAPQPKYWDVKASRVFEDISPERHQMRKWLSQVPHGGMVGDTGVLVVYNKKAPELSYLIVEGNK